MTESPDTGIIWAFDIPSSGPVVPLDPTQPLPAEPTDGYRWVHLDRGSPGAAAWLSDPKHGITEISAEALVAEETRPRAAIIVDELLVVLRGMNMNPGADPEDMVAIRMLVEEHRVITVRGRRVLACQDLRDEMRGSQPPRTPGKWLAQLIERLLDRMRDPLEALDEAFDELELTALDAPASQLRRSLGEARRTAVTLRRFLSPQRDAISRLAQDPLFGFDDGVRLRFRESTDRIARYLEDLEANRDRAQVTQEELSARLAESMNATSYRLTLVAAIFLPLGFLTGLFGINVGGMPLVDSKAGFWAVTIGMLAITAVQIWFFRKRKWW